jgi:hypothetical protein
MIGRFGRLVLVLCSALMLVGLTVGYAVAHCNGCINDQDLASNSVGGAELKTSAVHNSDIANGAVSNAKIANYAVSLGKVGPSARVRVGQVSFNPATASGAGPQELVHFNVPVPAAGVLYVSLHGFYYIDNDATTSAAVISNADVGLCDATASMTGCLFNDNNGRGTEVYVQDADNTDPSNQTPTFVFSVVAPVTAGTKTFYVNVANISGGTFHLYFGSHADVTFVPGTALAITTT